MIAFPTRDFMALVPVAILTVGAIALLLSEVFLVSNRRGYQSLLTVAFAAAAGLYAAWAPPAGVVFGRQGIADNFSAFVTVIVCGGLALSALVGVVFVFMNIIGNKAVRAGRTVTLFEPSFGVFLAVVCSAGALSAIAAGLVRIFV